MAALERMYSSIWRCSRAGAKTKAYIQKLFSAVCLTLPSIQPKVLGSRGKQPGQKLENQSQYDAHNFKFVARVCGPLKLKGFKLLIMICNQPRISIPLLFVWGYAQNNMINQCYLYMHTQSFYFQTGGLLIPGQQMHYTSLFGSSNSPRYRRAFDFSIGGNVTRRFKLDGGSVGKSSVNQKHAPIQVQVPQPFLCLKFIPKTCHFGLT